MTGSHEVRGSIPLGSTNICSISGDSGQAWIIRKNLRLDQALVWPDRFHERVLLERVQDFSTAHPTTPRYSHSEFPILHAVKTVRFMLPDRRGYGRISEHPQSSYYY